MSGLSAYGGCWVDNCVMARGRAIHESLLRGRGGSGQRINRDSVGLAAAGEGAEALLQDFHEDSMRAFGVDP